MKAQRRERRVVSEEGYRRITLAALIALYAIVVTGSLVRLTGSGLGCDDWPRCNEEKFIDVSTGHGAIEQVNRLFTGVVTVSVILAVLGSLRLARRRRILTVLSVGLVVGVLAQVVIGGIVVLTGLNPWANMTHFLVSMVLLSNALVLHRHAGQPDCNPGDRKAGVDPVVVVAGFAGVAAIVTGTVVTATGPHAGDEEAVRFGFSIHHVARIHGSAVVLTLAVVAVLLWRTKGKDSILEAKVTKLFGLGLLQALVGYVQYLADVPALLVAVHIALAAGIWLALTDVLWTASSRRGVPSSESPDKSPALSR